MKDNKVFYKMTLHPSEEGLSIYTSEYFLVHETPCFYFAVDNNFKVYSSPEFLTDGETIHQSFKRRGVNIHKFSKTCSRFAFTTKEGAYKHLVLLKRHQLSHLVRNIEVLRMFLSFNANKGFGGLDAVGGLLVVPESQDMIFENFTFD